MLKTTEAPTSPFGQNAMRLRMTVPMDWRRPTSKQSYQLYWDDEWDYGMLYPRPSQNEVAEYYDIDYYTHQQDDLRQRSATFRGITSRVLGRLSWQVDQSIHITKEWFQEHFGNRLCRILDVGCGSGSLLAELKQAGHEVVGLEPDPAARKIAKERGVTVFDGSAENYPDQIELESFDAVFMIHVLEHTVDPVTAVRSAAHVLKMGGKFIAETPNHKALSFHNSGITWRWLDVPRHLNFFTEQSLQQICRNAALEPATTEYRGYMRQFDSNWIQDEQIIWDRYQSRLNGNSHMLPKRNTQWEAWKLFSQTLFADDQQKYDSLRVIATK